MEDTEPPYLDMSQVKVGDNSMSFYNDKDGREMVDRDNIDMVDEAPT